MRQTQSLIETDRDSLETRGAGTRSIQWERTENITG